MTDSKAKPGGAGETESRWADFEKASQSVTEAEALLEEQEYDRVALRLSSTRNQLAEMRRQWPLAEDPTSVERVRQETMYVRSLLGLVACCRGVSRKEIKSDITWSPVRQVALREAERSYGQELYQVSLAALDLTPGPVQESRFDRDDWAAFFQGLASGSREVFDGRLHYLDDELQESGQAAPDWLAQQHDRVQRDYREWRQCFYGEPVQPDPVLLRVTDAYLDSAGYAAMILYESGDDEGAQKIIRAAMEELQFSSKDAKERFEGARDYVLELPIPDEETDEP